MTEETKAGTPEDKEATPSPRRKAAPSKEASASESREERLAAALRANLKRRKTQSRGRKSGTTSDGSAGS
jgi:hypothetical protein